MMDAVMRQESQVLFQRPSGSRVSAIKPKGPRTRASCSSASFPALAPPMLSRAQKEPTGVGAVHKLMMPSTLALQDFRQNRLLILGIWVAWYRSDSLLLGETSFS